MKTNKENNKNWYPQPLTATLLSVILGILTGFIINLSSDSFSTNPCLIILEIFSILLFILSSIATWNLLNIRIEIDEDYLIRIKENKSYGIGMDKLWTSALNEKISLKKKFFIWKLSGIIPLALGLILMIGANFMSRTDNIKQVNKIFENSSAIFDSLEHLNRKMNLQNKLVQQITDSIQSIIKEIQFSKELSLKKEQTAN